MVEMNLWRREEVTGSLSPRFSELPNLQVLNLGETKVLGDIEALKKLRKLTELYLRKTNVIGDIAALENLRKLTYLDLRNTNVIGDMSALENLTSLEEMASTSMARRWLRHRWHIDWGHVGYEIHIVEG